MFERIHATSIEDLMLPVGRRERPGVYFARVCGWDGPTRAGVWAFHEAAARRGVVLDGPLGNPDGGQMAFLTESLGGDFSAEPAFLEGQLAKWMPRLSADRRGEMARGMAELFGELRRQGKNDSALRSLYFKLMAWLYYRFERLMPLLDGGEPPRALLRCPAITGHELALLRLLNGLGTDVLLLQQAGDGAYLKQDPASAFSQRLGPDVPFPADFTLKGLRREMASAPKPAAPASGETSQPVLTLDPSLMDRPRPTVTVTTAAGPRLTLEPAADGQPRPGGAPAGHAPAPNAAGARLTLEPAPRQTPGPRLTLDPAARQTARPASDAGEGASRPGAGAVPSTPRPNAPGPRLVLGNEAKAEPAAEAEPPLTGVLARFAAADRLACTNRWMAETDYRQLLTPIARRGDAPGRFYNAFLRVRGVPQRDSYVSDLRQFGLRLEASGRRLAVLDDGLGAPEPQEVSSIRRGNYRGDLEMIADLASNLPGSASVRLQNLMRRAFAITLLQARNEGMTSRRLLNAAVYLLCWIRRYQGRLFTGYRDGDVPCLILMGGCANETEALYPRYLSRLPVDVLILAPDLNRPCALRDPRLAEQAGEESLPLTKFPREGSDLRADTAASVARDELGGRLTGEENARGESLTLRTTPDELFILWNEALKYRTGYAAAEGSVTMPVLYATLSGVEKGDPVAWWQKLGRLVEGEDCLFWRLPTEAPEHPNPYRALALKVVRDGKLDAAALRRDGKYPFAMLREPLQQHLLAKLDVLLRRRQVRGTFESGVEYTVVATVLDLDREILRLLQSFDFTGRNPKLVCACADERGASLEDAIRIAYLNLVGFDIALVVPTGYQTVERHLREDWPVEHRVGPFMYDLAIPDLRYVPKPRRGWLDGLLGRR